MNRGKLYTLHSIRKSIEAGVLCGKGPSDGIACCRAPETKSLRKEVLFTLACLASRETSTPGPEVPQAAGLGLPFARLPFETFCIASRTAGNGRLTEGIPSRL